MPTRRSFGSNACLTRRFPSLSIVIDFKVSPLALQAAWLYTLLVFSLLSNDQRETGVKNQCKSRFLRALLCLLWRFHLPCVLFQRRFHIKAREVLLHQRMNEPIP